MNTVTTWPTNTDDVIDSRDVVEAIEQLRANLAEQDEAVATCNRLIGDDDVDPAYLAALESLADEASDYCEDWQYGATLIRDSYFEDYAREFADDIGAIDSRASWPLTCIDWEQAARELQQDYTSVDFDGVTYWVR